MRRPSIFARLCVASFFIGPWIINSPAQTTNASIIGDVSDSSHAVVPQARIEVRNTGTGALREVVSSDTGAYRVYPLDPGRYDITISKAGFRTQTVQGVVVDVAATVKLDFTLDVGAEFAPSADAKVNMAVRSGSRDLHASVYERVSTLFRARQPVRLSPWQLLSTKILSGWLIYLKITLHFRF